ncbi:MAG: KOW domain-containing RNA-binding protein [Clostridia bacterium]|nr:KOW domain-containing RNA-binding protein [Clostridia bacterium]MBR6004668.1 KOW domain-containing RNA-binding protein [Clostridia bacterium]
MEPLECGRVVVSLAGRDKGRLLAVTGVSEKGVLVCDGKERPVERPKLKNVKHLRALDIRLEEEKLATNRALRKALAQVSARETEVM